MWEVVYTGRNYLYRTLPICAGHLLQQFVFEILSKHKPQA